MEQPRMETLWVFHDDRLIEVPIPAVAARHYRQAANAVASGVLVGALALTWFGLNLAENVVDGPYASVGSVIGLAIWAGAIWLFGQARTKALLRIEQWAYRRYRHTGDWP